MGLLPQQVRCERAHRPAVREKELIESHKFHGRMTSRRKSKRFVGREDTTRGSEARHAEVS
jgi:hypothetical protein